MLLQHEQLLCVSYRIVGGSYLLLDVLHISVFHSCRYLRSILIGILLQIILRKPFIVLILTLHHLLQLSQIRVISDNLLYNLIAHLWRPLGFQRLCTYRSTLVAVSQLLSYLLPFYRIFLLRQLLVELHLLFCSGDNTLLHHSGRNHFAESCLYQACILRGIPCCVAPLLQSGYSKPLQLGWILLGLWLHVICSVCLLRCSMHCIFGRVAIITDCLAHILWRILQYTLSCRAIRILLQSSVCCSAVLLRTLQVISIRCSSKCVVDSIVALRNNIFN